VAFGVARLRYVFAAMLLGCLVGSVFVEGSSRLGILFSSGVITFASLNVLCHMVGQDLQALADRIDAPDTGPKSNAEPNAAADRGRR
jgi:hypothetical protein